MVLGTFLKTINTIVTAIITKLIHWEFSPVMFRSRITELIIGEFLSGSLLQDFAHGVSVRVSSDRRMWGVFGNGPETLSNEFAWNIYRQ